MKNHTVIPTSMNHYIPAESVEPERLPIANSFTVCELPVHVASSLLK